MDLTIISEDKVKITLDRSDVSACGLDPGVFTGRCGLMRQTVNRILKFARADFISKSGDDLKVECFPGRDGGCELFVSRLERAETEVYVFASSDAFLSFILALGDGGLPRGGKAYRCGGAYYIELRDPNENERMLLSEFGRPIKKGCALFLEERGERLGVKKAKNDERRSKKQ